MSHGGYKAQAMIKTIIGSECPLQPHYQHVRDLTESVKGIYTEIQVIRLTEAKEMFLAHQYSLERND